MVNDSIGDFITQLLNATAVKKKTVSVPHSKLKMALAEKLSAEGFVGPVARRGRKVRKVIEIELLYKDGAPHIHGVRRVSKLSRRVYRGVRDIRPVRQGTGRLILSTPQGIMTGEHARKAKVGGEALFTIW
jgi:small subunit ribosomal protein S8